jgi:hypothetical protein
MAWLTDTDKRLLWLTLLMKLLVLLAGGIAYSAFVGGTVSGPYRLLQLWHHWDAPHYLDLIVFGYRATDAGDLFGPNGYRSIYPGDLPLYIVFFPLFPWLATVVNAVVNEPLVSAFIVASAASFFVAPLMYRLVRHDEGEAVALRSAWLLLFFPTAYFLHIPYTEALFMALVLGSFLAARTERWWLAGILGGLAAMTRVNGLILILALAAEAAWQWYSRPSEERRIRVEWLAIGLVGVGFAAYLLLNLAVYGTPFEFLHVQQSHWFKSLAPPWEGIASVWRWTSNAKPDTAFMIGWMELLFIGIGLAGTIHAGLRLRPSWFAWMAGNWLLFISTSFVMSVPRYSLTLFPLFVSLGLATSRRWVLVAVSAVSLAAMFYFAGRFAIGWWAF